MTGKPIEEAVATYYAGKLQQHGLTPRGVDWKDAASQELRFAQLARLFIEPKGSVADFGCGYGSFLHFMRGAGFGGDYLGLDISPEMVSAARDHCKGIDGAAFEVASTADRPRDYAVASGIFNVRLAFENEPWLRYIHETLEAMDRASTNGFAFNCLTSYSDADKMRPDLYYADPLALFDRCKRRYGKNVALLHDYGLYEFTILVRKDGGGKS